MDVWALTRPSQTMTLQKQMQQMQELAAKAKMVQEPYLALGLQPEPSTSRVVIFYIQRSCFRVFWDCCHHQP